MKKIVIFGATSAMAQACIRALAKDDCEFVLVGRNELRLRQIQTDLQVRMRKSEVLSTDLSDLTKHAETINQCISFLGHIDIVLIAHGTLPDQEKCSIDNRLAMHEFVTNGTSAISLLNLLGEVMKHQKHGTLAVISSVAGDRGRASNYLYGSAKAALSTFTDGLRAHLFRYGVHVLLIKPGFVDTPMTQGLTLPKALLVGPDHVAKDVLRAIERKTSVLYTPWFWKYIMLLIVLIPNALFKRLKI
jgi:decaprenylphospho-beta-D-erythro-pentofuranosid-2-ulose 2-reductase